MSELFKKPIFKDLISSDLKSMALKAAIFALFVTLSFVNAIFQFVTLGLLLLYICFENSVNSIIWIVLSVALQPFISINHSLILGVILFLLLTVKLLKNIFTKQIKICDWRLLSILFLTIAVSIILLIPIVPYYNMLNSFYNLLFIWLITYTIIDFKEIKFRNILIIFSTCVAFFCVSHNLLDFCGIEVYKNILPIGNLYRFNLFLFDPNYTGGVILLALISVSILMRNKKLKENIYDYILFFVLSVSLFFTLSKAAFMGYGLLVIYLIVAKFVKTLKTRTRLETTGFLIFLGVITFSMIISYHALSIIISRLRTFESTATGFESIDNLTTGRLSLWISYIKKVFASPMLFLFGYGGSAPILEADTHNIILSILYRYGFVSLTIISVIFIIGCLFNKKRLFLKNIYAPIITVIFYLSLSGNFYTLFYAFFFIFAFFMNTNDIEKTQEEIRQDI